MDMAKVTGTNRAYRQVRGSSAVRLVAVSVSIFFCLVVGVLASPALASAASSMYSHAVAHSASPSITVSTFPCTPSTQSATGYLDGGVDIEYFNPPSGANVTAFQITGGGMNINYPPYDYWSNNPGSPNPVSTPIRLPAATYTVSVQWSTAGIDYPATSFVVPACGGTTTPCVGNGPAPPPITGLAASYVSAGGAVNGYWKTDAAGGVSAFGSANSTLGSMGGCPLNKPVTGIVSTPDGGGYWLVASDGGIFAFGDAGFHGSTGSMVLNAPVVSLAPTHDNGGYWLVASDGGIFSFGDAQFHGSAGGMHLNEPVVGIAATPDGGGYWLVASDGGIFSFGDAQFYGSAGSLHLNAPIVGMVPTSDGGGYFLVGADGGVFTYGDAVFSGSAGGAPYNAQNPAVGVVPDTQLGNGSYWLEFRNGTTVSYGGAPNYG
jgi:hypothetical protein